MLQASEVIRKSQKEECGRATVRMVLTYHISFFCFPNRLRSDPEKAKKKEGRACCQIENTPPEGTRGCSRLEVGKRKKRSGKAKEQEE